MDQAEAAALGEIALDDGAEQIGARVVLRALEVDAGVARQALQLGAQHAARRARRATGTALACPNPARSARRVRRSRGRASWASQRALRCSSKPWIWVPPSRSETSTAGSRLLSAARARGTRDATAVGKAPTRSLPVAPVI